MLLQAGLAGWLNSTALAACGRNAAQQVPPTVQVPAQE